jgi:hypothetical protein
VADRQGAAFYEWFVTRMRESRRGPFLPRVIAGAIVVVVLALGAYVVYLGPWEARESDDAYIALAAATPQGRVYFERFPDAGCSVSRGRQVTVNCDTVELEGSVRYPQEFRAVIDARTNSVSRVDINVTAR